MLPAVRPIVLLLLSTRKFIVNYDVPSAVVVIEAPTAITTWYIGRYTQNEPRL